MVRRKDLLIQVRSLLFFPEAEALILRSVVEINTGLICGCTPVLKPFFARIFPKTSKNHSHNTQASLIWMGKDPDDQSQSNYRNFIELERGRNGSGDMIVIDGIKGPVSNAIALGGCSVTTTITSMSQSP